MHTPSSSNTNRPFQLDHWLVHTQYTEAIPIPRTHKDLFADTVRSWAFVCTHTLYSWHILPLDDTMALWCD